MSKSEFLQLLGLEIQALQRKRESSSTPSIEEVEDLITEEEQTGPLDPLPDQLSLLDTPESGSL